MKRVPRAESKFEVEEPISQFHCLNRRAGEPAIDFAGCVHGCRQPKLLAIVLAGDSNPARLHQPPQASDDEACILVERDNPIVLAAGEGLESMSDEPPKVIHRHLLLCG